MSPVHRRTITQDDLDAFARLSGDDNPVHVDPGRAAQLTFGTTVAHGMLLATVCDGALRRTVDWPWRAAALTFPAPTPAGTEVAIHLTPGSDRAGLDVELPQGDSGCQGSAAATAAGLPEGALDVPTAPGPDGPLGMLVGRVAQLERDLTTDDLARYATLADVPAEQVQRVPLPMVAGLFSCLLGTQLPGPGTNYLKQALVLDALPPPGRLHARVEVCRVRPDRALVDLATSCVDEHDEVIAHGRALVLASDVDVHAIADREADHG